jgi:hypothetical protein
VVGWKEVGELAEVVVGDGLFLAIDDHHAGGGPVLEGAGSDEFIGEVVVEVGGAHGGRQFSL